MFKSVSLRHARVKNALDQTPVRVVAMHARSLLEGRIDDISLREQFGVESIPLKAKRALDVTLALLLGLAAVPVLLVAAALVKLTGPGPALLWQQRIGHRGHAFEMLKLRTMVDGAEQMEDVLADEAGDKTFLKIEDDSRITGVGRILRRLSIDELPQLYNVLRGDMSLVGPRPLLRCDFRKFPKSQQLRRFMCQPGMTGLWQVSGRSERSDRDRMQLDLEYLDRWSLWLDLEILLRTVPAVLSGRGAT